MVYAMVAGRYENIFQPAQFFYFLGMGEYGPHLANRINKEDIYGWKPGQGYGNKEYKSYKKGSRAPVRNPTLKL